MDKSFITDDKILKNNFVLAKIIKDSFKDNFLTWIKSFTQSNQNSWIDLVCFDLFYVHMEGPKSIVRSIWAYSWISLRKIWRV